MMVMHAGNVILARTAGISLHEARQLVVPRMACMHARPRRSERGLHGSVVFGGWVVGWSFRSTNELHVAASGDDGGGDAHIHLIASGGNIYVLWFWIWSVDVDTGKGDFRNCGEKDFVE